MDGNGLFLAANSYCTAGASEGDSEDEKITQTGTKSANLVQKISTVLETEWGVYFQALRFLSRVPYNAVSENGQFRQEILLMIFLPCLY